MILDSNIIIYSAIPENEGIRNFISSIDIFCSRISCVEVLGYHKISAVDKLKFESFFKVIPIIEIDILILDKAIQLKQKTRLSLGDSIIAATALLYYLPVVTKKYKRL